MPEYPTIPTVHGRRGTIPLIGSTTAGSAYDPDAQAFFTTYGITDTTEKEAVNDLVVDLKAQSWYATNVFSFYPFVGPTAAARRANLINSDYNAVETATITYSASGAQGDGTTGFLDTNMTPDVTAMTQNSASSFCYLNVAGAADGAVMGCPTSGAQADVFQFFNNLSGTSYYFSAFGTDTGKIQGVHSGNTTGCFIGTRYAAGNIALFRNGTSVLSGTGASESTPPSSPVYLFARNNGGSPANFSNCRMAFLGFGTGFNPTQAATLNTILTSFVTTLSRT